MKFFRWFFETAKSFSIYNAIQLLSNIIFLACCIFEFDLVNSFTFFQSFIVINCLFFQKINNIDFEIFLLATGISNGLVSLFLPCFFGKMATDSYEDMAASLYDFNWHELPVDLQKYWLLILNNAQIPLYYTAADTAILNLETFAKVSIGIHGII